MTRLRHPAAERLRRDAGVVSVETALVIPLLLAVVGGTLVFGLRMWASASVDNAARAGLRVATLRETLGAYTNDTPYAGTSGYRNGAAVLLAVRDRLPGGPTPVACSGTGASAVLPSGATTCVAVSFRALTTDKLQGDHVSVTVVQRVASVEAASRFVPAFGPRLAASVGTVRATAVGRLE